MAKVKKSSVRSDYQRDTKNIWFPNQVEPDPEDKELFKTYWKQEKDRCTNGFALADGQVYIPGWLYFHTVYWTIELDKEIINPVTGKKSSIKTKGTPLLRDIEWIVANDLQRCKEEGKIYNLVGSRGFGKSFMSSSFIGDAYTFIPDSECLLTGGNNPDIAKLAEKVDLGLSNIHPVFQKQRLKNNWKIEVRAGWIDKDTGFPKGSNSRILARNYDDGNNSMATNGTRPLRQIVDEIGKIPNLIKCVLDSMPSWMNDYGFFSTPILTGTGGDMEVGEEAGTIFNNPEVYNVLDIEDEYEGKGKIGRFIPVTLARNEYKYPKTMSEYLGISHPDLDQIIILVSNPEECMEKYVKPRRAKALKSTTSNEIIKEKAYYPVLPSECFLTVSANDFPVEACKQHQSFLQHHGYKPRRIELYQDINGIIKWKDTDKMPVTDFPVKSDTNKEGVIEMIEPPVSNAPWGLYVAGIDPYKVSESDYSDSLGSVYIFKRMTTDMTEPFQYMPVAWYAGRPKDIRDWHENVRMLLELYQAEAMCEANDETFIQYMIGLNKGHYLAKGQSSLREIAPTSKFKGSYGLPATARTITHWLNAGVVYCKELHEKIQNEQGEKINVLGVSKILDPMLLEEIVKFNKNKGNFDRVRSFCIAIAYAKQLDSLAGKIVIQQEYTKSTKIIRSPFGLNRITSDRTRTYLNSKSPFTMSKKY